MSEMFLVKLLERDFEALTIDEISALISDDEIFALNKKDKKTLEKIIENNLLDAEKEKAVKVLKESVPSAMAILNNLDKFGLNKGTIKIDFREALLESLNKMNNLQLCVFIDKMMMFSKECKLNFLRNRVYSLHEINSAVSRSFGLSLAFEIFKPGKYKQFQVIDHSKLDKKLIIDTINRHVVHYLYILEIISKVVLLTDEDMLMGTKINKTIRTGIDVYLNIIRKEKVALRATGVRPEQTWTYTLCNLLEITVEDDDFFDEEDIDE